jgi:carbon-monoxide dehydrogenase small subunit
VWAVQADGCELTTVRGLAAEGELHDLQNAFLDHAGSQCGFCTPGMMLTARALLDRHARAGTHDELTDQEIREAISGQICRCTGYATIVRSICWAAERESADKEEV